MCPVLSLLWSTRDLGYTCTFIHLPAMEWGAWSATHSEEAETQRSVSHFSHCDKIPERISMKKKEGLVLCHDFNPWSVGAVACRWGEQSIAAGDEEKLLVSWWGPGCAEKTRGSMYIPVGHNPRNPTHFLHETPPSRPHHLPIFPLSSEAVNRIIC